MPLRIIASLPDDRTQLGDLVVSNELGEIIAGPFPCDGKSDEEAAIAAGNPTRNPEQPFGDTPLGEYTGFLTHFPNSPAAQRSFGPPDESGRIPIIDLEPQPGPTQAWRAFLNHRVGLAIHCGDPNGAGGLRSTHGCIRLSNPDDHAVLMAAVGNHSVPVSVIRKP